MGKSLGWQYNKNEQQEWEGGKAQEVLDNISVEAKQWLKVDQLTW